MKKKEPSSQPLLKKAGAKGSQNEIKGEHMNATYLVLEGRYPEGGMWALNNQSEMVVRIHRGEVALEVEGEERRVLKRNQVVVVPACKKYY
jgi:hypothetical protein